MAAVTVDTRRWVAACGVPTRGRGAPVSGSLISTVAASPPDDAAAALAFLRMVAE